MTQPPRGTADDPVQLHAIWSKSSRNPALERLVSIVRHTLHAE